MMEQTEESSEYTLFKEDLNIYSEPNDDFMIQEENNFYNIDAPFNKSIKMNLHSQSSNIDLPLDLPIVKTEITVDELSTYEETLVCINSSVLSTSIDDELSSGNECIFSECNNIFDNLSKSFTENFKSSRTITRSFRNAHKPSISEVQKERKFFRHSLAESSNDLPSQIPTIDEVIQKLTKSNSLPDISEFKAPAKIVKTYGNKRKLNKMKPVVESFGLPDNSILPLDKSQLGSEETDDLKLSCKKIDLDVLNFNNSKPKLSKKYSKKTCLTNLESTSSPELENFKKTFEVNDAQLNSSVLPPTSSGKNNLTCRLSIDSNQKRQLRLRKIRFNINAKRPQNRKRNSKKFAPKKLGTKVNSKDFEILKNLNKVNISRPKLELQVVLTPLTDQQLTQNLTKLATTSSNVQTLPLTGHKNKYYSVTAPDGKFLSKSFNAPLLSYKVKSRRNSFYKRRASISSVGKEDRNVRNSLRNKKKNLEKTETKNLNLNESTKLRKSSRNNLDTETNKSEFVLNNNTSDFDNKSLTKPENCFLEKRSLKMVNSFLLPLNDINVLEVNTGRKRRQSIRKISQLEDENAKNVSYKEEEESHKSQNDEESHKAKNDEVEDIAKDVRKVLNKRKSLRKAGDLGDQNTEDDVKTSPRKNLREINQDEIRKTKIFIQENGDVLKKDGNKMNFEEAKNEAKNSGSSTFRKRSVKKIGQNQNKNTEMLNLVVDNNNSAGLRKDCSEKVDENSEKIADDQIEDFPKRPDNRRRSLRKINQVKHKKHIEDGKTLENSKKGVLDECENEAKGLQLETRKSKKIVRKGVKNQNCEKGVDSFQDDSVVNVDLNEEGRGKVENPAVQKSFKKFVQTETLSVQNLQNKSTGKSGQKNVALFSLKSRNNDFEGAFSVFVSQLNWDCSKGIPKKNKVERGNFSQEKQANENVVQLSSQLKINENLTEENSDNSDAISVEKTHGVSKKLFDELKPVELDHVNDENLSLVNIDVLHKNADLVVEVLHENLSETNLNSEVLTFEGNLSGVSVKSNSESISHTAVVLKQIPESKSTTNRIKRAKRVIRKQAPLNSKISTRSVIKSELLTLRSGKSALPVGKNGNFRVMSSFRKKYKKTGNLNRKVEGGNTSTTSSKMKDVTRLNTLDTYLGIKNANSTFQIEQNEIHEDLLDKSFSLPLEKTTGLEILEDSSSLDKSKSQTIEMDILKPEECIAGLTDKIEEISSRETLKNVSSTKILKSSGKTRRSLKKINGISKTIISSEELLEDFAEDLNTTGESLSLSVDIQTKNVDHCQLNIPKDVEDISTRKLLENVDSSKGISSKTIDYSGIKTRRSLQKLNGISKTIDASEGIIKDVKDLDTGECSNTLTVNGTQMRNVEDYQLSTPKVENITVTSNKKSLGHVDSFSTKFIYGSRLRTRRSLKKMNDTTKGFFTVEPTNDKDMIDMVPVKSDKKKAFKTIGSFEEGIKPLEFSLGDVMVKTVEFLRCEKIYCLTEEGEKVSEEIANCVKTDEMTEGCAKVEKNDIDLEINVEGKDLRKHDTSNKDADGDAKHVNRVKIDEMNEGCAGVEQNDIGKHLEINLKEKDSQKHDKSNKDEDGDAEDIANRVKIDKMTESCAGVEKNDIGKDLEIILKGKDSQDRDTSNKGADANDVLDQEVALLTYSEKRMFVESDGRNFKCITENRRRIAKEKDIAYVTSLELWKDDVGYDTKIRKSFRQILQNVIEISKIEIHVDQIDSGRLERSKSVPRQELQNKVIHQSLCDKKKIIEKLQDRDRSAASKNVKKKLFRDEDVSFRKRTKSEGYLVLGRLISDVENSTSEGGANGDAVEPNFNQIEDEKIVERIADSMDDKGRLEAELREGESELSDASTDFNVGDLVWAKLGSYPFWPCLIIKDPETKVHKKFMRLPPYRNETDWYHVKFFGDKGRRAWSRSVIHFKSKDDLKKLAGEGAAKGLKSSFIKESYWIKHCYLEKWREGVNQAESLKMKTLDEKLKFFDNLLLASKSLKKDKQTETHRCRSPVKGFVLNLGDVKSRSQSVPPRRLSNDSLQSADSSVGGSRWSRKRKRPNYFVFDDYFSRKTNADHDTGSLKSVRVKRPSRLSADSDTESQSGADKSPIVVNFETQTSLYRRNQLFKGLSKERVCQICAKPGELWRCKGPCVGSFHVKCVDEAFRDLKLQIGQESRESIGDRKEALVELRSPNVKILTYTSRRSGDTTPKVLLSPRIKLLPLNDQIDKTMEDLMRRVGTEAKYADTTDCSSEDDTSRDEVLKAGVTGEGDDDTNPAKRFKHVTAEDEVAGSDFRHVTAEDEIKHTSDGENETKITEDNFKCGFCTEMLEPPCFICKRVTSKKGNKERQKCAQRCGTYYHTECFKPWPQTQWSFVLNETKKSQNAIDSFVCPRHVCHVCTSENPGISYGSCATEKLAKCLKCPATYHNTSYCVPAGTEVLAWTQIICSRHGDEKRKAALTCNTNWCFICSNGGDLVCCESCPTSVHRECLPLTLPEDESYICEDCESGRFPLYDDIVWVKMGSYRWWPALVLFPNEVPAKVRAMKHLKGEYVVKFFGTYDHYWVGRGRTFLYQEGDKGDHCSSKSRIDEAFTRALEEAANAHKLKTEFKVSKEALINNGLKPPPFIRIKVNRPVGNVRLYDGNLSSMTSCECDPRQPYPCGPETDCLNRLLLTECNPSLCPAGKRCKNQMFEKREYPPLTPFKTKGRGWGLKALAPVKKGQFVIEYVGEMIDDEEYQRRILKMHQQKDENYYFLTIDKDRMIDAGPKGNVARFMNHSCQPNCETQKWTVNGATRVGLFARRDIPVGIELTFNYNLESVGKEKKICRCDAPNCSGYIGVKPQEDDKAPTKKLSVKKTKKKKRAPRRPEVRPCFICGRSGKVGNCNNKTCSKFYHLKCVNLDRWPKGGKWMCPCHSCNVCTKRTTRSCTKCTNSYCPAHSEGNVRHDSSEGFLCSKHDRQNGTIKSVTNGHSKRQSFELDDTEQEFHLTTKNTSTPLPKSKLSEEGLSEKRKRSRPSKFLSQNGTDFDSDDDEPLIRRVQKLSRKN